MENYFLKMLQHLRHYEEVLLYANIIHISPQHEKEALSFLEEEYLNESTHFPYQPPAFDAAAALWSGRTVYSAAQLLLYRRHIEEDLPLLLPDFAQVLTPSAILSADMCLRFMPHIITHLKMADPEDPLITVLQEHLRCWHYSSIGHPLPYEELEFGIIMGNDCLSQLYADRVITRKDAKLAALPPVADTVKASFGIFASEFWKSLPVQ